ncbi:nose resistant to fluoxetine protein 6 isoform X3 [Cherax quadricarinatus]|uniref:nose resistant to fluoxetine protein 6 isoform X3 n=1 Tax=Cherax quadricarinatus TaxID=27406 RepID=UPI00387E5400
MTGTMVGILTILCVGLVSRCSGALHYPPASLGDQVKVHGKAGGEETGRVGSDDPKLKEHDLNEIFRLQHFLEEMVRQQKTPAVRPGSLTSLVTQARSYLLDLAPLYLPDPASANPECRRDLLALYTALAAWPHLSQTDTLWPLKLIDSWGKFADGVLVGNFQLLLGFFTECVSLRVSPETKHFSSDPDLQDHLPGFEENILRLQDILGYLPEFEENSFGRQGNILEQQNLKAEFSLNLDADFQGQYCLLTYGAGNTTSEQDDVGRGRLRPAPRTPSVSALLSQYISLSYYATCMPSTCTPAELKDTVEAAMAPTGLEIKTIECQVDQPHHLDSSEITGLVLVGVMVVVLAAATLLDLYSASTPTRVHYRKGHLQYLLVFSVSHNIQKLFQVTSARSPEVITCLHGIRFLSITWVVLGHQYAYSTSVAQNTIESFKLTKKVAFQVIANADVSVDTFFFMSGLLVSAGLLRRVTSTGKFNVLQYYIHRIVRLLPPIAVTVMLVATVSEMAVGGPASQSYTTYYLKGCRHSWWTDVTFTSNFFFSFLQQMGKTDEAATCLPHCWYTAVDMQLYVFTPIVLLPLCYWPKSRRAWAWVWAWTGASVVVPAVIVGVYHTWPASLLLLNDTEDMLEYNHKVYLMPWCRAGPYIVGIWAGYLLHRSRDSPRITRLSTWQVVVGWACAWVVALAVLLGIARYNYADTPDVVPEMTLTEAVLYGGLHRAAWAAALAWVVLACHWGYGGELEATEVR